MSRGRALLGVALLALLAVATNSLWMPARETVVPPTGAVHGGRASAPGLFQDVTAASGVTFVPTPGDGRMDNLVESVGAGGCVLDADGDGHPDLFLVDQGWAQGISSGETPGAPSVHRLFRNRGDGTFQDVSARAGIAPGGFAFAALAADVEADGDTDLYLLCAGPNRLLLNRGDGTFEDGTARAGLGEPRCSVAGAFFDADQDGDLDLYVGNYVRFDPAYRLHYAPDVFPGPLAYAAEPDALYLNQGDGTFKPAPSGSGLDVTPGRAMGVSALDADGDGRTDLFVANDASRNFLFRALGGGRFEEVGGPAGVAYGDHGESTAAMAGSVGDLDGDGLPDVFVTDTSFCSLYLNRGRARFEDRTRPSGVAARAAAWPHWGAGLLDLDNDGDLDLFAVAGDLHHVTGRPNLLLFNRGDGSFEDATERGGDCCASERPGRGALAADLDSDGWLDLIVLHLGQGPAVLRNRGVPGRHGLLLELRERLPGRVALGAKVSVTAGGRTREVVYAPGIGYLGQHDPRLHLGLGEVERAERVVVRWNDGSSETWRDVPTGRAVRLVHGEGVP